MEGDKQEEDKQLDLGVFLGKLRNVNEAESSRGGVKEGEGGDDDLPGEDEDEEVKTSTKGAKTLRRARPAATSDSSTIAHSRRRRNADEVPASVTPARSGVDEEIPLEVLFPEAEDLRRLDSMSQFEREKAIAKAMEVEKQRRQAKLEEAMAKGPKPAAVEESARRHLLEKDDDAERSGSASDKEEENEEEAESDQSDDSYGQDDGEAVSYEKRMHQHASGGVIGRVAEGMTNDEILAEVESLHMSGEDLAAWVKQPGFSSEFVKDFFVNVRPRDSMRRELEVGRVLGLSSLSKDYEYGGVPVKSGLKVEMRLEGPKMSTTVIPFTDVAVCGIRLDALLQFVKAALSEEDAKVEPWKILPDEDTLQLKRNLRRDPDGVSKRNKWGNYRNTAASSVDSIKTWMKDAPMEARSRLKELYSFAKTEGEKKDLEDLMRLAEEVIENRRKSRRDVLPQMPDVDPLKHRSRRLRVYPSPAMTTHDGERIDDPEDIVRARHDFVVSGMAELLKALPERPVPTPKDGQRPMGGPDKKRRPQEAMEESP